MMLVMVSVVVMTAEMIYLAFSFTAQADKDLLFGKYYMRAIASAISCRDVAMARLAIDPFYLTTQVNIASASPAIISLVSNINVMRSRENLNYIPNIDCKFSVSVPNVSYVQELIEKTGISSFNSKDIYIQIESFGQIVTPRSLNLGTINANLRSVAVISYSEPIILNTQFVY